MKSFLLTSALLVAAASSTFAQEMDKHVAADFGWEIGVNGGFSPNTIPQGPSKLYTGTSITVNPAAALHINYNINENWQVGAELGGTHWQTTGTWQQNALNGQTAPSEKVTFNIADAAVSFLLQLNHVIPSYSAYTHYNKSNFYYGISAGIIATTNDARQYYSQFNAAPDPQAYYVSKYDYGYGIGFALGAQVGYAWYLTPHFGFNADVAGRWAYVGNSDTRYAHVNSSYNILYFPVTVGVRLRL